MAVKKTPVPSKTVTKEQITELQRLNARQAQTDAAQLPAYEPYTSPTVPEGSDAAVAAAEVAAAEAEKIQADIASAGGEKAYVLKNAPSTMTTAQMNAILPEGQKISTSQGGQQFKATDGSMFNNYQDYLAYQEALSGKYQERKSAFDDLYTQFAAYGLGSLVEPLRALVEDATVSPSDFSFKLMYDPKYNTAYKQRFSANEQRIKKGLTALTPAAYLAKEDKYQEIMRNYGLPESYWTVGPLGKQEGFDKLIENDVSSAELEDRILNAQNRVLNANPEVLQALKNFYPDIKNGDILAYVLDPQNALSNIKKKVSAAEIGGAALAAGLLGSKPEDIAAYANRAQELGAAGVTGEAYQKASPFLTTATERGSQLADIYKQEPYGRTQAEAEAFNITGATEAARKRRKLTELEKAAFGGSSGTSGGALSRDRAISPYMMGTPGAGAF